MWRFTPHTDLCAWLSPLQKRTPLKSQSCNLSIYLSVHWSISLITSNHGLLWSLVLRHPPCTLSARRQLTLMDGDGRGHPARPINQLSPCHNQWPPPSIGLPPPRVYTSVCLAVVPLTARPAGEGSVCGVGKTELMMKLGGQSMAFHTPWHWPLLTAPSMISRIISQEVGVDDSVVTDGVSANVWPRVYFSLLFLFQRRSLFCLMGCMANGGVLYLEWTTPSTTHAAIGFVFHFCTNIQLICSSSF